MVSLFHYGNASCITSKIFRRRGGLYTKIFLMHKRLPLGYTRAKTDDYKKFHFAKKRGYTRGGYTWGITVVERPHANPKWLNVSKINSPRMPYRIQNVDRSIKIFNRIASPIVVYRKRRRAIFAEFPIPAPEKYSAACPITFPDVRIHRSHILHQHAKLFVQAAKYSLKASVRN